MPSERLRVLELALEALENQKKQIDAEIAELSSELMRGRGQSAPAPAAPPARKVRKARKRSTFSKEERARRGARMKAYWDKWRKEKAKKK